MAPNYNLNHPTTTYDYPFMTCIVKVNTRSSYCSRRTVAKLMEKCSGVRSFRMDNNGVVEISGTVDPSALLKVLARAGKSAELCWLQFGECSSNLFMAANDVGSGGGGTCYRDGRYLHASNLYQPKLPSQTSNLHNYGYDRSHNYYCRGNKRDFQFASYGQNLDSYHHQHYDHTRSKLHQFGYGLCRKQTNYRPSSLQSRGDKDIGCCRVM